MEVYALGLLILIGLIGVALRVSKGSGYKEAQLDEKIKEQELSNENLKKRWKNEALLKSASITERDKLLDKWTRK